MSSIISGHGDTFHGISVDGRGVFTHRAARGMFTGDISFRRSTYAGQCKDGYACGLGVTTLFEGHKYYAEYGPDGKYDGWCLFRNAAVSCCAPRCLQGHHIPPVRARRVEGRSEGVRQLPSLRVQLRGLLPERSALACADSAGRSGRGAPRSPSHPPLRPQAIVRCSFCPPQALAKAVATEVHR